MAYVPDEAVDFSAEITATSFKIYAYICRRRNHERRYAWLSVENIMTALTLSKSTVYESIRELEDKGWLWRSENSFTPQKGDFWPVDKRYHAQRN